MSSILKNLSDHDPKRIPSAKGKRIAVIVSEWNSEITFALRDGALTTLKMNGAENQDIELYYVPGTFELTYAAAEALNQEYYDAIICLGCVIKGETPHFDYICQGVANGLSFLNAEGDSPIIFGVLTTDDLQQAQDRSGGKHGNKGIEAAVTALKMIELRVRMNQN